jgi:catechol 2,3-dioxygenase-like lactoylglutathione lyase family enzyme
MTHPSVDQQITFLYTSDLKDTTHFYGEVIGLELALDQGLCRIYRVTQDSFVGICQRGDVPEQVGQSSHVIFTLVTHDVDGWYNLLRERGVVFEKPPALNPTYNIYHCFLRDPNGYLIEIQHFLDPSWPG